jgi:cobalt-zinc-cadmium efflux system protein
VGFVAVEAVFALISGSMALLADAGHNLSDVLGLLLAWGATVLATRRPTARHTYGFSRSTILAALLNALILLIAVGAIAAETVRRIGEPGPVASGVMIWVAGVGVVINSVTAALFMSGRKKDLNIQGAFLHMAADAAVSLGVVVTGVAISATAWYWLDPAVGLIIVAIIMVGAWRLLRDSVSLSLDAVPKGIDPEAVKEYLLGLPGVEAVHDLHIWAMSTTDAILTVHLVKPDAKLDDALLAQAREELYDRFGIGHATVQLECVDELECGDKSPGHH